MWIHLACFCKFYGSLCSAAAGAAAACSTPAVFFCRLMQKKKRKKHPALPMKVQQQHSDSELEVAQSSLLGTSLILQTLPFKLCLGPWEELLGVLHCGLIDGFLDGSESHCAAAETSTGRHDELSGEREPHQHGEDRKMCNLLCFLSFFVFAVLQFGSCCLNLASLAGFCRLIPPFFHNAVFLYLLKSEDYLRLEQPESLTRG